MSLRGAVLTVPLSRTPRAPPHNAANTGRATPRETPREAGSRTALGGGGAADMQSGSGFRPFALVSPSNNKIESFFEFIDHHWDIGWIVLQITVHSY